MLERLSKKEVNIPGNVPKRAINTYIANFLTATKGTGKLMLFAGDQKVEHLNDDFYGKSSLGKIPEEDNNPEHLFRIANSAIIGCFASQYGLISHYCSLYPKIPYVVKVNSKTNIIPTKQKDPLSKALVTMDQILELKKSAGINIVGVGYTLYLGSEYESEMLKEASQLVVDAHKNGLLAILWIYPRGKAIKDEKDPHLIAGAAGVAACLGADFVKVSYPKKKGEKSAEILKEAVQAAGRCGVVVAGGSGKDAKDFLQQIYDQIHISGTRGNATGRNIHQRPLAEAVKLCNAISSITFGSRSAESAYRVYKGEDVFHI